GLFGGAFRTADVVLVLRFDPEMRGKVGKIRKNRGEGHAAVHALQALVNRPLKLRYHRDHHRRLTLSPMGFKERYRLRVVMPDRGVKRSKKLLGTAGPAAAEQNVVHLLQALAGESPHGIDGVQDRLEAS